MTTLNSLDWQEIIEHLKNLATSESARTALQAMAPLASSADAERSFREIEEFRQVIASGSRPKMTSLDLYASWMVRLEKQAVLKTLELKDVRLFCLDTLSLGEVLQNFATAHLTATREHLLDADPPLSAIDQIMTPDGEIRTDASETLYRLYNEKKQLSRQIENHLAKLIKDHGLEDVLQDRFVTNREGRWVVPVKSGKQHDFTGIIHGASQSKQTVFMEPQEITPLNNRLRQVEVEIQDEINALLKQLSDYLFAHLGEFKATQKALIHCDFRLAQAHLAQELSAENIRFSPDHIELKNLRHPLLILSRQEVIANSVTLNPEKNILLLSGPNAGGKTVLLKSIGLAAQMARCGLPVCADVGSSLPFFTELQVAVGDEQSVDQRLSTFAAHLRILNAGLAARGPSHLILIDEICGSTDPEEGSALARSFIEKYAEHKIFGIITSHLGPLKSHWSSESGVLNGSLEYDCQTGQPTYQFIAGVPGQSQALQTAKRIGVDTGVVERAYTLLSPETKNRLEKLDEVERLRDQLQKLQKEFRHATEQARRQKDKFKKWLDGFNKEKEERLQAAVRKAEKKMNEMFAQAKVEDVFRKHEKMNQMKQEFPRIVRKDPSTEITNAEEFTRKYPPGSQVFVASIGQNGVVQSLPNAKGQVTVQSASMRLQIPWKELTSARSSGAAGSSVKPAKGSLSDTLDDPTALDLRGKTVDEAIELLEIHLDRAVERHSDRLKVIHGHGTNTLKRAVRGHLSRSVYVQNWSVGSPDAGGDGVTWVELKDNTLY